MAYAKIILTEEQLSRIVNRMLNESVEFTDFTHKGSANQALGKKSKAPNTGEGSFGPLFTQDIGYGKSITNNIEYHLPKSFSGPNTNTRPGTKDKKSNLKIKDNFQVKGVKLKTHGDQKHIKIGKHFEKDIKKGTPRKKASIKQPGLHPNRHSSSERITNVVHKNNITRGGVVFDSSFKPNKGGDPFSVKT
jgi:hypothetical protein|tara:strand:+ start:2626 stop:3198 length:573 start_codon:yes stop_codon:yes gene_type:complete